MLIMNSFGMHPTVCCKIFLFDDFGTNDFRIRRSRSDSFGIILNLTNRNYDRLESSQGSLTPEKITLLAIFRL